MESDDNNESSKTFTTLTNYCHEPMNDSKLQFEKFLFAGDSDSEIEHEENFPHSDDSNGFDEEFEDIDDPLSVLSDASQQFALGSEDFKNSNSQCLDLTDLIRMNRNEKFQLLQLFHKIKDFLIEIQNRMKIMKKSSENVRSKETMMYLGHVGAPYFKTKKEMFGSDPNPDTLDRRKRGLLTIYQNGFPSRWSRNECDNLTRGVKLTYNLNKQRALLKEIGNLKRKISDEIDSAIISQIENEIEKKEGEIRNLKAIGIEDVPPLCENKFIDWDHIATEYLMDKHTARECSSFWRIYLHPDINKSNWSTKENKIIKELAEKYNYQDWDRIAQELGTNRSAFTVFIHYSSTLCNQLNKIRFTEEEDRVLLQYVESKKIGSFIPWNSIAEHFPDRSKIQIIHRYKYYLRNMRQYTNEFSDAEDILILILVERFGRNYIQFPKYIPSKSYMQIKSRYDNHLRFNRVKGSFTLEEDKLIMDHFSSRNLEITHLSAQMKRNRISLRQRYNKLIEFFEKHPGKSLKDVPRRFGKKNETFRRLEFLKYVVDQFKDELDIPTISDIENKLGKKKKSRRNEDFDNLLVGFFSSSYATKQKSLDTTISKIKKTAEQIHSILKIFGVNLRIPAELKKNNTLDIVDLEILGLLREKEYTHMARPTINELLPPNMNSLIGLRGLLLKNQSYKKNKNRETIIYRGPALRNLPNHNSASESDHIFKNMDSDTQSIILFEREVFLKRFISMFMWPALLSIESPSSCLLEKEFGLNNSNKLKKTYKKKNICENESLKRKVDGNFSIPPAKKTPRISHGGDDRSGSVQPTRSSSRLKDKKEMSGKEETISIQQVKSNEEDVISTQPSGQVNFCNELEKSANVGSNGKSTYNLCESTTNKPVILSNLVRVDKSEIIKLMQGKKPIKIIKIQCIKEKDGSLPTQSQPNMQKLQNVVTFADNIKDNTNTNSPTISQNSNSFSNSLLNLDAMKNTLKKSLNKNKVGESSLGISKNEDAEDIDKLDDILNNVEDEESIIDLTESEVMKNEVDQLDQLIKQEKSSCLF